MNILITGVAGFIGYHCALGLIKLKKKYNIYGLDNLNSYYDVKLKKDRLKILNKYSNFNFNKIDITNKNKIEKIFKNKKINIVINLAASAGVRYSLKNPETYLKNNINGFFNILELSVKYKIKHLLYASSSSVYGDSKKFPLHEETDTSKPLSFYAASKKCNEVMAYSFANINNLPTSGLRFFTVYGEYGRPDMALYKFATRIVENKKIDLYNKGNHIRDFTYIDDVINQIIKLINKPSRKKIPYEIYNIASSKPIALKKYIKLIELNLDKKSKYKLLKKQPGDVYKTYASTKKIKRITNQNKVTKLQIGIERYIKWFKKYYFK
tara:strand:- start:271 stop:1242 length:972 start_codon:yes stop_codon:yes gene_type:complete